MMLPPLVFILEEEKTAGVGRLAGSGNPFINYVMEKCLNLLHVWGSYRYVIEFFMMTKIN